MKRLLVVDDEVDICGFVKDYFQVRDFEVDVAYDGKEALRLIAKKKHNIVLLDIRMPLMDGLEALKEIRRLDENIKIIFITAYNDLILTRKRLLEEGAYAFVEKPISSLKNLEFLVNQAVGTL